MVGTGAGAKERTIMTKADEIRKYYRDNPSASVKEVVEATGIADGKVRAYISKDVKAGRCIRTKKGIDYSSFFYEEEERSNLLEWKNEVRRELIDQLLEANRRETASDQIRLNAKEINKLLNEVSQ